MEIDGRPTTMAAGPVASNPAPASVTVPVVQVIARVPERGTLEPIVPAAEPAISETIAPVVVREPIVPEVGLEPRARVAGANLAPCQPIALAVAAVEIGLVTALCHQVQEAAAVVEPLAVLAAGPRAPAATGEVGAWAAAV